MWDNSLILGQIAYEFDHKPEEIRELLVPREGYARLKAVLECRNLGLLNEVLVQGGLRGHVAEGDAGRLDDVDLAGLC